MSKIPLNTGVRQKKIYLAKIKLWHALIKKYKSPTEKILTIKKRYIFSHLCKSIIGQQISVAAANSVFSDGLKKNAITRLMPKTISKLSFVKLKSCGLK